MDLAKILSGLENSSELITKIEAEIGADYVPRKEFYEKNNQLKTAEAQIADLQASVTKLGEEKTGWEDEQNKLNQQIKGYEMSALKAKVAHEAGLPYELATRLTGEDENSLKADAEALVEFIKPVSPPQPLRSTETQGASSESSAYKTLLGNLNLGD